MELEVLVSTMNLKNEQECDTLIRKIGITGKALLINQLTDSCIQAFEKQKEKNRCYSIKEKGLSKSRNLAMKKLEADIGLFCDDDVCYQKDYEKTIKQAYQKYPKADIICFFVESKNSKRKIKRLKEGKVGLIGVMRIASFQITFQKKIRDQIGLDERFGANTSYDRGEETIFLCDAMKKGLQVQFVNRKIGEVSQETSTWFENFSKEFFRKQGAVFYRMNAKLFWVYVWQYAIRKYIKYRVNVKFIEAIREMKKGKDMIKSN